MSQSSQPVLELRHVHCGASRDISLRVDAGTFHVVTGESAGQTSALLRVLGLLDAPEKGCVFFEGQNIASLAEADCDRIRSQRCGFLFAAPFLLPAFSVVENVAMPLFKISHFTPEQARERTDMLLDFVGLAAESQHPIDGLTDLQQHAASLARALANEPSLLIVESFENSLATEHAEGFATLLRKCCARFGVAVVASGNAELFCEPGDRLIVIDPAGFVRESIVEGKPSA